MDSERSDTRESGHGSEFRVGQRVHYAGDSRRIGSVKYVGPVEGYSGTWIGIDWDNGDGKHDGCHNGVRYFEAAGTTTASFVRPHNLSVGIPLLQALELRYRTASSKEEEDEMYVFSASNKRVTVELLGKEKIQNKLSHFEELTSASLSYLGVSSAGDPFHISTTIPNLKELDLTGNLLSEWEDVGIICKELPGLAVLNLSHNIMAHDISGMPLLNNIQILVLNHTGISWKHVEILKDSFPFIEELHLVGNKLKEITPSSSTFVKGFDSLHLLNLDDNCIDSWEEIVKLSQLKSLEQLFLNHNNLSCIWYPDHGTLHETANGDGCLGKGSKPFKNLHSLLLGNNNIKDVESVDSLNYFPNLLEVRLSENPVTDPVKSGLSRFVLVARLAGVKIINGSEISPRERKESEIRYVRLVMSKCHEYPQEIDRLHPRFAELKRYHGIDDEKPQSGATGPQKMAAGLISITMKCIGASIGEKPPLTKKLPVTITVGKLKNLCESFFNIRSIKPKLFLQEAGAPFPTLLDDDMATLLDAGVGNESTILVDEE
ncbi:tubulin-folding cofactor E [Ipomoea triloba]|uniref:tubulin-folding cofactor E n=1 Tax=Ipomoea triloba TaxID=35885 RepID=UPI00125E75FA|nr:tubulin-folding cofactor E [Ipomoea triloba]XP_031121633.1 tubulin-folding cofactor E [Ipomoea triloba]